MTWITIKAVPLPCTSDDAPPYPQRTPRPAGDDRPVRGLTSEGLRSKYLATSVRYLATEFLQEVKDAGLSQSSTLYDIEPKIILPKGKAQICPRDGEMGSAYVDCVRGSSNVRGATAMLSYTWGYTIGDVLDGLSEHCRNVGVAAEDEYVWMCCLCINQHRVKALQANGEVVPFESFKEEFGERVRGIGRVVALMSPWKSPHYIKRVWCNFELYTAIELGENACEIFITMPNREFVDLNQALQGSGLTTMWETLADLDVERAEASIQKDKESIFKIIADGPGFHKMNTALAKHLQRWAVMSCRNHRRVKSIRRSQTADDEISLCLRFSELLMNVGAISDAIETLTEGQMIYDMRRQIISFDQAANLETMLGKAKEQIGQTDEALEHYLEARGISENAGTLKSAKGSQLLVNIAILYRKRGDVDEALKVLQEAQEIHQLIGAAESLEAAHLFKNMGMVQVQRNELSEALKLYDKATQIHKITKTLTTPHGAGLLNAIGNLKTKQGDIEGALVAYSEARVIRERTATLLTPGGAALQKDSGKAKSLKGDIEGAIIDYEEALQIREFTGTLESSGGAALLVEVAGMKLRRCTFKRGEAEAALLDYERASSIRTRTNTLDHETVKILQLGIAAAKAAIAAVDGMDDLEVFDGGAAITDKVVPEDAVGPAGWGCCSVGSQV